MYRLVGRCRVGGIEDVVEQRCSSNRPRRISSQRCRVRRKHRLGIEQLAPHARILRALTGEQHGDAAAPARTARRRRRQPRRSRSSEVVEAMTATRCSK